MDQMVTNAARHSRQIARPLERNINALMQRREKELAEAHVTEKIAARIAAFTGSMWSVALHLVVYGFWILANIGWLSMVPPWDPTLVILAMIASVESIFLTTFVLMNQNRLAASDNRRAELTLHISLLVEHEITKLVEMNAAMAEHFDIPSRVRSELDELAEEVIPEAVLDEIEKKESGAQKS